MLALLERCVQDEGGTYALCDTDSMAIVATEAGGEIAGRASGESTTALSWLTVRKIVERFTELNPYDRTVVRDSILKIETENFANKGKGKQKQLYAFVISAKRYALFNLDADDRIVLVKCSKHGLGYLLDPIAVEAEVETQAEEFEPEDDEKSDLLDADRCPKWIQTIWEMVITESLGHPTTNPDWFSKPAVTRTNVTSPEILARFKPNTKRSRYPDQIKPFNFMLAVQVAAFSHPAGADPKRFQLIAPYARDPDQWLKQKWINRWSRSDEQYSITTRSSYGGPAIKVKSFKAVFEEFSAHPEPKSADSNGEPCDRQTIGLLQRRPVHGTLVRCIGKESNKIDEAKSQLIQDHEEIQLSYENPRAEWLKYVVPILKLIPLRELVSKSRISERAIKSARNGHSFPTKKNRKTLLKLAADYARSQMNVQIFDDLEACAAYVEGGIVEN